MKTVLTNCTVINCTGEPPMGDMTVVIEGDKIAELKPGMYQQPAGDGERIFDLAGGYVLPGLWNVHAHLGYIMPGSNHRMTGESVADCTIRAGRNAMDALRAGVLGIRVVGDRDFIDVAWKRTFDADVFVGPRLFVCGRPISPTGMFGLKGMLCDLEVDGPYEMRKAVREQLKHGADQIKLMITNEVITIAGERVTPSQFCLDEVKAATEVAHQKGKRVCAHVGGPAGIKMAIQGEVDCIEHGCGLDAEAAEMMVENNMFYVPTICCTQEHVALGMGDFMLESGMTADNESLAKAALEEFMRESGMGETDLYLDAANPALEGRAMVARAEEQNPLGTAKAHREGFQKALKAGVKIACGADYSPIGEYTLVEIEHLVKAGVTEMEALMAATRNSADLCGVVDRLGTVEGGKLADLIVLSADPLENISNVRKLRLVFKGGKLVETTEPEGLRDFFELYICGLGEAADDTLVNYRRRLGIP